MTHNNQPFGVAGESSLGGILQQAVNNMANKSIEEHNSSAVDAKDKVLYPEQRGVFTPPVQNSSTGTPSTLKEEPTPSQLNNSQEPKEKEQTPSQPQSMMDIFYQKLEGLGVNLKELKPVLEDNSDYSLVASIAGAGKTTGLVLKIIHDLIDGSAMTTRTVETVHGQTNITVPCNILVSTFLKTGASDIEEKFREWVFKLGLKGIDMKSIRFSTIHSETYRALKSMGQNMNMLSDTRKLLRDTAKRLNIQKVGGNGYLGADELRDLESIVSYARNRLDSKRYDQLLASEYNLDAVLLDMLITDFKTERQLARGYDFEDLQEILLEGAKLNPNVAAYLANSYDYVIVDEFQDTSQLQYELLKYYFKNSRKVMAIGDDDQTIYSFRGSDSNIIVNRFIEDFKPTVLKLTTNYRCHSNILGAISTSIVKNENRIPKDLNAYKEGGMVNLIVDGDINHLVTSIHQDVASKKTVGVMARVNADLLMPAMLLEIDNTIDFQVSKSVTMNATLPKQVYGMIDLVTKRYTGAFESLLRCFVPRYKWYEVDTLVRVLKTNDLATLYNLPMDEIRDTCPTISPILQKLREHASIDGKQAYLYILSELENNVYNRDSDYCAKGRELVRFTRKLIMEHDRIKNLDINGIDNLFNSVLPSRIANRIRYEQNAQVKLTTVHEAKGKEWDSCYIWNDTDTMFPYQFGNRDLTPDELEEERRVHYIAFTRAKEKLTVYTYHGREGLFLKEVDMSKVNYNPNVTDKDARLDNEFNGLDGNGVPTTVYRKAPTTDDESAVYKVKGYLDQFLDEVGDGSIANSTEVSFVLDKLNYNKDVIVNELIETYGLNLTKESNYNFTRDYLTDYFENKANAILNQGLW